MRAADGDDSLRNIKGGQLAALDVRVSFPLCDSSCLAVPCEIYNESAFGVSTASPKPIASVIPPFGGTQYHRVAASGA